MSKSELSQQEIDTLLNRAADRARKASEAHRGGTGPAESSTPRAAAITGSQAEAFEELLDVPLTVRIRLGEAEMSVEELVSLRDGSVVELDHAPGDPVDVLVNDRVVARGEIVVVDDRFSVRVTEITAPEEPSTGEAESA